MTGCRVEMRKKIHRMSSTIIAPFGSRPSPLGAIFIGLYRTDRSPGSDEQGMQEQPCGETADMRPPGHPADLPGARDGRRPAEDLTQGPEQEVRDRRDL